MASKTASKIHKMVDEFLAVPVKSDGGSWPEVSEKDFDALYELFEAIVDAKFERDCDGDSVINFAVVNRKKHMPINHYPVGYRHKAKNMGELLRITELHQIDLSHAADDLRADIGYMRSAIEGAAEKGVTPDEYLARRRR